jgi:hypothetical protein
MDADLAALSILLNKSGEFGNYRRETLAVNERKES